MSNISEDVLTQTGEMVTGMMKIYQEKIDKAYLKAEKTLVIDIKAKFKAAEGDHVEVETSINFVTDRIKTSFVRVINEKQDGLFEEGKKKKKEKKGEPEKEQQALSPARPELTSGEGEVVDAEFTEATKE